MTRIVDLHQDLVLSYTHDPRQWQSFDEATYTADYPTNAGSRADYLATGMNLIWWVVRPYDLKGDIADKVTRKITYSPRAQQQYIDMYHAWIAEGSLALYDPQKNIATDQVSIVLHIEWCDWITSIADCEKLYTQWVRSLWFVRNFANALSWCNLDDQWLTSLGTEVIQRANHKGVIIDTAHMNHRAMMETLTISHRPIINSHSNLKAFSPHPRNVTDEFVRALADRGGIVWLSVCKSFIETVDRPASIDLYCDQIQHCRDIGGDEVVAFGSDYHGLLENDIIPGWEKIKNIDHLYNAVVDRFWLSFAKSFFVDNAKRILWYL